MQDGASAGGAPHDIDPVRRDPGAVDVVRLLVVAEGDRPGSPAEEPQQRTVSPRDMAMACASSRRMFSDPGRGPLSMNRQEEVWISAGDGAEAEVPGPRGSARGRSALVGLSAEAAAPG